MLLAHRDDVHGTVFHAPAWRLEEIPGRHLVVTDLLVEANLDDLLDRVKPRTVFNCVAYGAYSFEAESDLIYETNFNLTAKLLKRWKTGARRVTCIRAVRRNMADSAAGSERRRLAPNPTATTGFQGRVPNLLRITGRGRSSLREPPVVFRLRPLEDSSRLIPTLINAVARNFPPFVNGAISRELCHIDDLVGRMFSV